MFISFPKKVKQFCGVCHSKHFFRIKWYFSKVWANAHRDSLNLHTEDAELVQFWIPNTL